MTPDKVNPMFKIHLFECAHLKCVLLLEVCILSLYYTTMIDIILFPDYFLATQDFFLQDYPFCCILLFVVSAQHMISHNKHSLYFINFSGLLLVLYHSE